MSPWLISHGDSDDIRGSRGQQKEGLDAAFPFKQESEQETQAWVAETTLHAEVESDF